MLLVVGTDFRGCSFLEHSLARDALAGCGPHIGNVKILAAVVVEVDGADAHAGADVFHASLDGDVGEGAIAIVAVEIFAAEVVDHVEVGPAISGEVAPAAAETVTGIVLV